MTMFMSICLAAGLLAGDTIAIAATDVPARFIIDMVHNNPGEPLQATAFRDPRKLAGLGYNGQGIQAEADSCETFDAIAPDMLAQSSVERTWIEQHAQALELQAKQAHDAGIKAYAWFQFIVLPKAVVARYKADICDGQGRIDLERPMTQKLLRAQVDELFDRCPDVDGLVVRTGEIYLQDSPYHTASGKGGEALAQGGTAILHGPASHIALLKLLREEVCTKRNKLVLYRTWDFGNNFHINPRYYLQVTDAIEPHPNLVFSIKYSAGDFLRMTPFNPTLGSGHHRQMVEVECQAEYYGKGAHPYYIGDGVINGWEEYPLIMKSDNTNGLRSIVTNANFAGIWTWSRGGGWEGPYISNELWCELNAWVMGQYARNPQANEAEIFNRFARERLGLQGEDVARFRELNLLSAAAVLRGHASRLGDVDKFWARDDKMGALNVSKYIQAGQMTNLLAEKAEAAADFQKIEVLAHSIHFADPATQEFVETSAAYGRIKFALFEQAWTILLYGAAGETMKPYDRDRILAGIKKYDALWQEWRELKAAHPSCATLYHDYGFGKKPGIGAAVERYRKICTPVEADKVILH